MKLLFLRFAILTMASMSSGQVLAQYEEGSAESERIFRYGESCSQLTQLSRVEIVGVTHPAYGDQFYDFCKPEGIYRCEDYSALLQGLGSLEDNGQSSCRYLPR